MASKRPAAFPTFHHSRKRRRVVYPSGGNREETADESVQDIETPTSPLDVPNDTKVALLYMKSVFPVQQFEGKIPTIMLKHQLYSISKDKTVVDRQLNELWEKNEVRLFKLTSGSDEFAVVFTEDYAGHIKKRISTPDILQTVDKFLNTVLPTCIDVSVTRTALNQKFKLSEEEVTQLVNVGVLTVRDVGTWWLAIPAAGIFMKNFMQGRKALIRMIRQRKYKEILEQKLQRKLKLIAPGNKGVLKSDMDLETRNLNCHSKLGMVYHIHDIVGAEIVKSIETTSGRLLRLDLQT